MAKSKRTARPARPASGLPDPRFPAAPLSLGTFRWPRDAALCAGLALFIALAYWPVAGNDFVHYDDDDYVVENEFVNQGLSVNNILWAMTSLDRANWHPLTWISHMLDCQLFGRGPTGHHLVSLGLHTLNSLLLYCVLLRMTRRVWPSIVVATFFAMHPLHVESVAWVAERKDVLSTFFGLLALAAWLHYLARPSLVRYAAVLLCFAASLMSKPMWVTLPFLLLLLDYWPLGRAESGVQGAGSGEQGAGQARQRASAIRLVVEKLPLILLSAASCIVTMVAQSRGEAVLSLAQHSLGARLATVAEAYCSYLWKMALPVRLAPIYPLPKSVNYSSAIVCGATLVLFTALLVWYTQRYKYLAVGWFWYLGTLVPVIGIVHVGRQSIADRYTYLPSVGIFLLIAWFAADLVGRWPWIKRPLAGLTVAALVACCFLTSAQVRLWATTETLFAHTAAVTEDNSVALTNLGLVAIRKENYAEAEQRLREALQIDPANIDAMGNLASMYVCKKKYNEALATYEEMLVRHHLSGDKASKAYALMARTLELQGNHAGAEFCLGKAIELEPASVSLRNGLALAQQMLGKTRQALENYALVLRLKPGERGTINNIAWIYATHPDSRFRDGGKAIELLQPLASTSTSDANFLDTLAAAYAEARRFDEALQTVETAIVAAGSEGSTPASIADMEHRAALYKKRQPYRDQQLLGPPNASQTTAKAAETPK